MATLDELYFGIARELQNDGLGDGDAAELMSRVRFAVSRAIERHANEQLWFNRIAGNVSTSASPTLTVALPTGMRIPLEVSHLTPAPELLTKVPLNAIYNMVGDTGRPTHWAENEGAIQFYPIPDAVYVLKVYGIEDLGVPSSVGGSNHWTAAAYDLIHNEAAANVCRSFRDYAGAESYQRQADRFLADLRRETRQRSRTPLTSDLPFGRGRYNIFTDS